MLYIFSRLDICMRSAPNYPYVLDTMVCYPPTFQNLAPLNWDDPPSHCFRSQLSIGLTWGQHLRIRNWHVLRSGTATQVRTFVSRGKLPYSSCVPLFRSHTVKPGAGLFCRVPFLRGATGASVL